MEGYQNDAGSITRAMHGSGRDLASPARMFRLVLAISETKLPCDKKFTETFKARQSIGESFDSRSPQRFQNYRTQEQTNCIMLTEIFWKHNVPIQKRYPKPNYQRTPHTTKLRCTSGGKPAPQTPEETQKTAPSTRQKHPPTNRSSPASPPANHPTARA